MAELVRGAEGRVRVRGRPVDPERGERSEEPGQPGRGGERRLGPEGAEEPPQASREEVAMHGLSSSSRSRRAFAKETNGASWRRALSAAGAGSAVCMAEKSLSRGRLLNFFSEGGLMVYRNIPRSAEAI